MTSLRFPPVGDTVFLDSAQGHAVAATAVRLDQALRAVQDL
ncbi:hypothetical protein STENM36S_07728 [Streptomyces tendae]